MFMPMYCVKKFAKFAGLPKRSGGVVIAESALTRSG